MIVININKAKSIAHEMRRAARAAEFAPLDFAIAAHIPGQDETALEQMRQEIRIKYANIQVRIDNADTVEAVKEALA